MVASSLLLPLSFEFTQALHFVPSRCFHAVVQDAKNKLDIPEEMAYVNAVIAEAKESFVAKVCEGVRGVEMVFSAASSLPTSPSLFPDV